MSNKNILKNSPPEKAHPIRKGIGFGLTSGIITTLGLIVGLNSGTHSKLVVTGGILIIAIADALSDALGMHISEESGNKNTKQIWLSTIATLFAKFLFALTFLIPVLIFTLTNAIIVSIIWGLFLIGIFSYYIAKKQSEKPIKTITEHLFIAIIVIIATYFVGELVSKFN